MKKFLKNISILLVVFAFIMLFKCSEATLVGGVDDKVMADSYTLSDGTEAILVSPNKGFSAELPLNNKDEYKPNRLYLKDLEKFLKQNLIEFASIKTLDGKNTIDDKTELFTGDIIVDTEGKERTIILCGDTDKGRNNICSADFSVIVHAYLQDEESNNITEIQRVAANLYNEDDQLNVFDIKSMLLKYLHYDGSNPENENKLGNTLLWSWANNTEDDDQIAID
ncbi:MAG: hypothetical protein J6K42_00980 [Clostridia bacterium]|nr:hypothetical protein [Clostridia bacterium]